MCLLCENAHRAAEKLLRQVLLFSKQAVESIEQVAHLCQSETEEVRNAARETTLSFGK